MKAQPEEEVFGTAIPRTSGGHLSEHAGQELRLGPSKLWKKTNKHVSWDIHDPKAWMSTTIKAVSNKLWSENFGMNFCSLVGRNRAIQIENR